MMAVILCGGKSTRLPHKLMLSHRNGSNIVLSAIETALNLRYVDRVVAVVNQQDTNLRRMIEGRSIHGNRVSILTDNFCGIQSIINELCKTESIVVLCGDNAYGVTTNEQEFKGPYPLACINPIASDTTLSLDGYHRILEHWYPRGTPDTTPLTTPWYFPCGFDLPTDRSLMAGFNLRKVLPIVCKDKEWADLGTPEGVSNYYGL